MEQQWDIYANVEEPSHNDSKWRRETKCSGDISANGFRMDILEPHNTGAALSGGGGEKRRSCRAAAVCLGLLSLLLLTGLITLVFLYTEGDSVWRTEKELLERRYNNLTEDQDQLQTSYNSLTRERDQLQTSYNSLTRERNQLQTSYNSLTRERNQLQTSYNSLTRERNQLQTSYNSLTRERILLQISYNSLTRERDQFQKRSEDLTRERNDLQTKIQGWNNQGGWVYFRSKFYYISSITKSWQESRNDCLRRGADLVIINSKEEQDFTRSFKRHMWIGLTDQQTEGRWRWVDGTPLITSYWASGEPNGHPRNDEDCAEIRMHDSENSWNDKSCYHQISWICEKATSP